MASLKRRPFVALVALVVVGGCTEPLEITPPGIYDATTYSAGPSEAERTDLLSRGITWTLTIREDRSVIDQWDVVGPNNLVSHTTVSVTAHREGNTITFMNANPSDRILTARTWTLDGDQITAVNQTVDGVNAVIRFTRR